MNIVFRLAWRNLWRQPRRTWLTTGAMVFSNVLLVFMMSLQFGMYGLMIDNSLRPLTGHLQLQAPGFVDDQRMRQVVPAVRPLAASLRTALGSSAIAARAQAFALASSEQRSYGLLLIGVEPDSERVVSNIPGLVSKGRYFNDTAEAEIIVGAVLARNLRVDVGGELTLLGSARDGSFAAAVVTVVGIFDSGVADLDRSVAQLPLGFFDDVFSMQGAGHAVVVNAPHVDAVADLKRRVEQQLPAGTEIVVHDWDRLLPGLKQAIQADLASAFFMYGVLAILVAFSVLNTQLMSVLERTREFGIVMALGLKPARLGRLVMLETAMMGLMGAILGAVAGALLTTYFSVKGFQIPGMEEMAVQFNLPARMYPQVTPLSLVAGPAIVLGFSLLAAIYPALRLNWLNPVMAMRAA